MAFSHAVRQQLRGNMRIPLSHQDWPVKFNKIAKYIGRHWPNGSLKLNRAREITAVLFGYNSTHDVKQELRDIVVVDDLSLEKMKGSLITRALIKYAIPPTKTEILFSKLPWQELSIWPQTSDAKLALYMQNFSQKHPGRRLIMDEAYQYLNYKTPKLFSSLRDMNLLPEYEYAVQSNGLFYRKSKLESDLCMIGMSLDEFQQELRDCGLDETDNQELFKHLIPMVWLPIAEAISYEGLNGQRNWYLPYMYELREISLDQFVIFHSGTQGYLPRAFHVAEIENALIDIYMGKTIESAPIANVYVDVDKKYINGRSVIIPGSGTTLAGGERVVLNKQEYIRTKGIKNYIHVRDDSWINTWIRKLSESHGEAPSIDPALLSETTQIEHKAMQHWLKLTATDNGFSSITYMEWSWLLTMIFNSDFTDEAKIRSCSIFDTTEYDVTDENDVSDVSDSIAELLNAGGGVSKHHPELIAYYDEWALGFFYKEYIGERYFAGGCYERDVGFIVYLISQQLIQKYPYKNRLLVPQYEQTILTKRLCLDLLSGHLNCEMISSAYQAGQDVIVQFKQQEEQILNMERYAKFLENIDPSFVSHGPITSVRHASLAEEQASLLQFGRKFNTASNSVTQKL